MLQEIRERAQGWVAWAIIILISIPFAFWGIDSYFGGGADPVIASVNGTEIAERAFNQNVNRTRIQLRERLGDAYDPALFGDGRLREQVLERMIRETLLLEDSQAMGMRTSDQAVRAAILSEPVFQTNGAFSNERYEQVLRMQGLSPAAYEDSLRRQLLSTQLLRAVEDTAFATEPLAQRSLSLQQQQRRLSYVNVPAADFRGQAAPPSEEAIAAYYEANQDAFKTPEQVRVSYLLLDAASLAPAEQVVDEAGLREQYQLRIDEFTAPEERRVRHILVSVATDADAATLEERRQQLLAVRQRIEAGEAFSEVAAETSDDPGSADSGGELGWILRGALDPAFEQAVFALEPGLLSDPVRSRFGYHLVEVLETRGGEPRPFESVREELIAEQSSGTVEGIFFDQAEQLATLTYEVPDSLTPAAEALDLEVQQSGWMDRSGGEGLFAIPRVVDAAFSEEVLSGGNNSELLEPDPEALQALVLRVSDHREPSVQALDEVRDEIATLLEARQAAEAAAAEADAIAARVRAGETLADAASGREVIDAGLVGRTTSALPAQVRQVAFSMPRAASSDDPSVESTRTSEGDALVVLVSEVVDVDPAQLGEADLESEQRLLTRELAAAAAEALVADMEARAKIERAAVTSADESQ
jgi:peptidyl-prolyl cis-trans isomerase D